MSPEQDETSHILKEARRMCLAQGKGLIVSELLKLDDGYVVVINNPVIRQHEQPDFSDAFREIATKLMSIRGVKRVVVEVAHKT
jgi:hypothetical protein